MEEIQNQGFEAWEDFNDWLDRDGLNDESQYLYTDQTYENAAELYFEMEQADIHHQPNEFYNDGYEPDIDDPDY